jgi:hypothetical protein
MGLLDSVDDALDRACASEISMLAAKAVGDEKEEGKHRRIANLAFRAAMKTDGNVDSAGTGTFRADVI